MSKGDGGLLSQDDIDALTKGLGLGAVAAPQSSGPDFDAARKWIRLLTEQSSSVVSTVLSRSVDFRLLNLQTPAEQGSLTDGCMQAGMLLSTNIRKELNGRLDLAMEKKSIAILADLMLMGSGNVDYTEDHKDAIQEIMNQIMGSASTTLSNEVGISIEVQQAGASDIGSDILSAYYGVAEIRLSVEGFPEQKVYWLMDEAFLQSLNASKLSEGTNSPAMDTSLSSLGLAGAPPAGAAPSAPVSGSQGMEFQQRPPSTGDSFAAVFGSTGNKALDLLMDIELPITIELGRTQLSLKRILELGPGAIVEMERFAGEPVDILINGKVVAKGEVVVVDENFGVRLVALVTPEERIKMLR